MQGESEGIKYKTNWGNDGERDAFTIELTKYEAEGKEVFIAEIVWWDESNRFTFEILKEPVPVSVIEALVEEAREKLKPKDTTQEANIYSETLSKK
ncbi:MAG: hypothetical protein ABJ000_03900 [Saccharospirillum sp.]|uniref:hypothetical protein n=1 Tax=Saccharospirillum sp. TaxID=2033801 RepID=UPI00329A0C68